MTRHKGQNPIIDLLKLEREILEKVEEYNNLLEETKTYIPSIKNSENLKPMVLSKSKYLTEELK